MRKPFSLNLIGRGPAPEDAATYERVRKAFAAGAMMVTPVHTASNTLSKKTSMKQSAVVSKPTQVKRAKNTK